MLDDKLKQFDLKPFIEIPNKFLDIHSKMLFMDNKLILVNDFTKMYIYDITQKHWNTVDTRTNYFLFDNFPFYKYKIFQQNNRLLALCLNSHNIFMKYESNNNLWSMVNIVIDDLNAFTEAWGSASFIITLSKPYYGTIFSVFNFGNAPSLRDICFLKLVKMCNNYDFKSKKYENIFRETIFGQLPHSLKRHYFGPEWTRTSV